MPWIEAMLRGQRVFARALDDGSLAADAGGRVEIRYKPDDGRAYRASARNLVVNEGVIVHPDEVCKPVAPTPGHAGSLPDLAAGARTKELQGHGVPSDGWIAYTDGACSGNPGPAGSGVVIVSPDGVIHEGLEYVGQATNNVAELTGILRALEWIPNDARKIIVHTDSQYAIGVLQKGWKAKVNQELVARTKRAVQARGARLVYVPGHQGVYLNERADELAREAVQTQATRRPLVK